MSEPSSSSSSSSSEQDVEVRRATLRKHTKDLMSMFAEEEGKIAVARNQLMMERREFDELLAKLKVATLPSPVLLNVGGMLFATSAETLQSRRNTYFGAMFSGMIELKPDKDGRIFIDRDGTHFRYVLNYLRNGELLVPEDKLVRKELLVEAQFYGLQDMISLLNPAFSDGILSPEHHDLLNSWAGVAAGQKWRLLFKGTRDSFDSLAFHTKCDNIGPTYTIVRSGKNVFGGYNPHSWNSSGTSSPGAGSFLFTIVNPRGVAPFKLAHNSGSGPYNNSTHGPAFYGGFSINGTQGSSNLTSRAYHDPQGYGDYLFGGMQFVVSEVEVYTPEN
eukprot:TRINITY_DN2726_c0_g1_i4.p1 TRINITY_DN2726_c0_g1~~TRINITY_DN2726_c0_g1_i4.p1  ORF type:complete len:332 (-),score=51.93 TRINITY_DN2726_c0_g1_i4:24-1019(-)